MIKSKELLRNIVQEVVEKTFSNKIELEILENIVYLSQKDEEVLFGAEKSKNLAENKVNILGKNSRVLSVPVLTGTDKTKAYITKTAENILGIQAPINYPEEEIEADNEIKIIGPKGEVVLKNRVSIRARFITLPKSIADLMEYKEGDIVSVKTTGKRKLIYENVKIFIKGNKKRFYLDLDEANAGNLNNESIVEIIKKDSFLEKKDNNEKIYKFEKDGVFIKLL